MTANISSAQKHCHQCNIIEDRIKTGSLKTCSGCRTVYYCSTDCQKQDWNNHKNLCRKVVSAGICTNGKNSNTSQDIRLVPKELQSRYIKEKTLKKMNKSVSNSSKMTETTQKNSQGYVPIQNQNEISQFTQKFGEEEILVTDKYTEFRNDLVKKGEFNVLINWFYKSIKQHPTPSLYLELSSILFNIANKNLCQSANKNLYLISKKNDFFAKSRVFRDIGMAIARADQSCIDDSTCKEIVITFNEVYPFNILSGIQKKIYKKFLKKVIAEFLDSTKYLSPNWIRFYGKESFQGILSEIKSPAECKSAREKELRKLLGD